MLYKKTEKLSIIKREGEIMGMFVNPNAAAFQCAVNSEVYIDKTRLLEYTNKVLAQMPGLYVTVVRADSGNLLR